ncbi:GNAT family N-acetyltransferase [Bizionia paragorgiae]|uniref:Protein N-acetyltransferase, RimJ/RimL family n=1 Tax=Bizionia paragorgiae TaxID=283786 RepID=A0A1H3WYK3_BIZPA|nr:GNAT family N-acetyltransferase [Bizionia paragorgiae]SDZ92277.1 Protein N-acetyltransferase, RimJ/RimL family [Bizionia paragorgiae]
MHKNYLFTSKRLGFRNWTASDLTEFASMNADKAVMKYFPEPLTTEETAELTKRLQKHYIKNGYTYYATDRLENGEFIGFIGFAFQEYHSKYTPAIDMGWRLKPSAWGYGYATEGAKRCLEFGFNDLGFKTIIAVCTENNRPSEKVMQKTGMTKLGAFNHPKLKDYPDYERCLCYKITKDKWQQNTSHIK